MYNPPAFRDQDRESLFATIRAARLALLVSAGAEAGVPDATHLPMVLEPGEGPQGTIYGHVARANPHWKGLLRAGRARAVFTGPEAYVSPGFYPSKQEHGRVVPTWNYVAVHAIGSVEVIEDPVRLRGIVARLTEVHEAPRAAPWAVDDAPEEFVQAQLKGIVGLALRIEELIGKRKLSQNRAAPDREGAIEGLAASADPRDRETAEAMRAAGGR